jgi:hypothetical protein
MGVWICYSLYQETDSFGPFINGCLQNTIDKYLYDPSSTALESESYCLPQCDIPLTSGARFGVTDSNQLGMYASTFPTGIFTYEHPGRTRGP